MKVVSSREFRDNQKMYFDLANSERVVIKRKNEFIELVPRGNSIPEKISPSGDEFYDNPSNIEFLQKRIAKAEQDIKDGKFKVYDSSKSIWEQLD